MSNVIALPAIETVEFGGLVWRNTGRQNDVVDLEYEAWLPGIGKCFVGRYAGKNGPVSGGWHASNNFEELIPRATLRYVQSGASCIKDTMEEAMTFCIEARALACEELKKALQAIGVGDPYSVGFRDGQQSIKDKILEAMQ